MKNLAMCAALSCAATACAASRPTVPAAAPSASADEQKTVVTVQRDATAKTPTPIASGAWIGASAASQYALADGSEQLAAVWVDAPDGAPLAHVPTFVAVTIDVSGSMQGDKIVQARQAAVAVLDALKDGDILEVSTFNDTARELITPTVLGPSTRAAVRSAVAEISADGATNIADALSLAGMRAEHAPASHPVRRVVLISDGKATAGTTDADSLAALAARGVERGVQVTSLGVGLDYDERTLNGIALRSSGRLFHLTDAQEMPSIIRNEMALLDKTVATNAFVELVPAPGVELTGTSNNAWAQRSGRGIRVPLGTVFAGQRRELLVRYRLSEATAGGTRPVLSARLVFDDPNDGGVQHVQEAVARAEATHDATLVSSHLNDDAQAIVAVQEASQLANTAREQLARGDFAGAEAELAAAEKKMSDEAARTTNGKSKRWMAAQAQNFGEARGKAAAIAAAPAPAKPAAARDATLHANKAAMKAAGF